MKKYFIIFYIFTIALVSYYLYTNYKEKNELKKEHLIKDFSNFYSGAIASFRQNAKGIFENMIMQEEVLQIVEQTKDANYSTLQQLHDKLYALLQKRYENLGRTFDIRQLHFHLANGRSFLRMHRPKKYGDYLFEVRETLKVANLEKKYVEGFEEGRIYNGFRYVYPIIKDGIHYGSVEISISMNAMVKYLSAIFTNKAFYFMIKKDVVDTQL